MRLQLVTTGEHQPDYLALPVETPLETWDHPDIVAIPVGTHRHVVRFLQHDGRLFALKELPPRLAQREWDHLRHLREEGLPVVDVLGVIEDRPDSMDSILITRHLEFSLPFRFLFARSGLPRLQDSLIDAVAVLLVRLHLVGFFWGDCSLSNALFRRDAGALAAWLVDTETGEQHQELTDGQRMLELDIAQTNVLGGLLDLQAGNQLSSMVDPLEVVDRLRARYDQLWAELTDEHLIDVTSRHLIDARLRHLNELGFDTAEISIESVGDGSVVRFKPVVVEAGHHPRLLRDLTGLTALENQARHLVGDLRSYGAWLERQSRRELPQALVAFRWLTEVYEPAIAAIPEELRDRRDEAELFHEILLHRDELVAARHRDVKVLEAARSYAALALPFAETERSVVE